MEGQSLTDSSDGGKIDPKPLDYEKPVGPADQGKQSPGLGGENHGMSGTQGTY